MGIDTWEAGCNIGLHHILRARHPLLLVLFQAKAFASLVVHLEDAAIADMPNMNAAEDRLGLVAMRGDGLPVFCNGECLDGIGFRMGYAHVSWDVAVPQGLVARKVVSAIRQSLFQFFFIGLVK